MITNVTAKTSSKTSAKTTAHARVDLLFQLFWAFLRIGPVTFGGGYAMIPMIEREITVKRKWMSEAEMDDILSLAGSAPGGVGVNAAAFIGYRLGGVFGAIAAIAGITTPTFIIVCLLSSVYSQLADQPKVDAAMKGIHGAVIALILVAAYRMAKNAIFDKTTAATAMVVLVVLLVTGINPIYVIAFGLLIGFVYLQVKQLLGLQVRTEKECLDYSDEESKYPEYYI
ncbi:chromate transporter [Paenibacillus anaericanus]|uniref:Chromate transporter n=1 Tax=Paenibacillus anaericanus TaxID=170367 RepID=A0A3S1DC97_9BACL|nr:chromate transporter [Paenibacillus anaericanus]RUT37804.1 chromate transporter [Paenibacillus anaericanus]